MSGALLPRIQQETSVQCRFPCERAGNFRSNPVSLDTSALHKTHCRRGSVGEARTGTQKPSGEQQQPAPYENRCSLSWETPLQESCDLPSECGWHGCTRKQAGRPKEWSVPLCGTERIQSRLRQLEMIADATGNDVRVIVIGHIKSTSLDIGV